MTDSKRFDTDNVYTNEAGAPVDDDQNTMTAGVTGPALLQDVHLVEKLAHFNRERIPERIVHAKGAAAFGYFEVTNDVTQWTNASFLSEIGKRTELLVRFSTVGGEKGSADTARDPRGFALKFYTDEGNYDLVMNNTPVFFINDPLKFPDFIHTQKRNPATNTKDPDMFWDFLSLSPESSHQVMVLFSDRGTPASMRNMNGYSGHTFMWYKENGEHVWVKYHFKTDQGIQNLTDAEATRVAGEDPDYHTRDLYTSIANGDHPSWSVYVQVMTEEQSRQYHINPFDITKVWPKGDFPLVPVGRMVLNSNPDNYFAEVEQAAFSPGNFVPGIGPSPDKMLQGRLFAYADAHRYRVGANYAHLPVNAARATKVNDYQRDGSMTFTDNGKGSVNYYPNSFDGPEPDSRAAMPSMPVSGWTGRHDLEHPNSDFEQPRVLYERVMSDEDRDHLIGNIVGHLGGAQKHIQERQASVFYKVSPDYGRRVAEGLGLNVSKIADMAGAEPAKAAGDD